MPDGGRLERRRGHERKQSRHVGEQVGRRWSAESTSARALRSSGSAAGSRLEPVEQPSRRAVSRFGRDAAGGRVRVREQALGLELGELSPHRRRRDGQAASLDERPRADRLAGGNVLLDDDAKDPRWRASS